MLIHFSAYMTTWHTYSYLKELQVGRQEVKISHSAMN